MRPLAAALLLAAAPPALAATPAPAAKKAAPAPARKAAAPAGEAAAPADAPRGTVVLFPGLGRPTQVLVTGRALPAAPAAGRGAPRQAARSAADRVVEVSFAGQVRRVTAAEDGAFEAAFAAPAERPFAPGLRPVGAAAFGAAAEGQVQVLSDAAPFLLVSDLEGTLTEGDGAGAAAVPGMAAFLACALEGTRPAAGAVVVSGAAVEAGPRVQAFLSANGFPFAALSLRRGGPRAAGASREAALRALLSGFPQAVVLVGDAGERDPERYAALRAEFPGRVAAVFVRDAGRTEADPARFEGMFRFTEAEAAAREAAAHGWADLACVERAFAPPPPGAPAAAIPAPAATPAPAAAPAPAPAACPPCPCPCPPAAAPPAG